MSDDDIAVLDALSELGEAPRPGERSDDDILAGALEVATEAEPTDALPVEAPDAANARPRRGLVLAFVAGVGLAAAAAIILLFVRPQFGASSTEDPPGSMAPDQAGGTGAEGTAVPRHGRTGAHRALGNAVGSSTGALPSSTGPAPSSSTGSGGEPAETSTSGESESPTPRAARPKTAEGLLSRAQTQLRDGSARQALRTYKRLIDRFPRSGEATAARVSMGRLELRLGRPKAALAHFDAYLAASAGGLVEEARYGRIRALRKLGRSAQELGSIEAFLAEYAGSVYTARLRKRAQELSTSP